MLETAEILHVPRQRPKIVQVASPDDKIYPSLEQAKASGWAKSKRRRSSATPGASIVRPVRSYHAVIESVAPEASKPPPADEDVSLPEEQKQTANMLTVEEVEDQLFKGKQRAHDSPKDNGPAVIAKLMAKLVIPNHRPKSAHGVLVPSSSFNRQQGTFPEINAQERPSVPDYVARPAPEVPTVFYPVPRASQNGTVSFSAPLVSFEFPQQRVALPRQISSTPQQPRPSFSQALVSSRFSPSSSSRQQQVDDQEPFQDKDGQSQFFFRLQKRPLGHNFSTSNPPLTLYQRRVISRRERAQGTGNQEAMPRTNDLLGRQSSLPVAPGTPTYRDVQMTPAQVETGQRIAAIWRDADAQGAYSRSVYSHPPPPPPPAAPADPAAPSAAPSAPASGHVTPDPSTTAYVPIFFRPSSAANDENADADSASTMGPISFNEVNNLMSLLTEHIVAQVRSSREAVVDALVARIDALGREVAHLKAAQQQLLAQQGALLNLAQRRRSEANSFVAGSSADPSVAPFAAPSGPVARRRPAHHRGGAAAVYAPPPPPPKDASSSSAAPRVRFHEPTGSVSVSAPGGGAFVVAGPRGGPLDPVGFGSGAVPGNHWYHQAHPPAGR